MAKKCVHCAAASSPSLAARRERKSCSSTPFLRAPSLPGRAHSTALRTGPLSRYSYAEADRADLAALSPTRARHPRHLLPTRNWKAKWKVAAKVIIATKQFQKPSGKYLFPAGGKFNMSNPKNEIDWQVHRAKDLPGPAKCVLSSAAVPTLTAAASAAAAAVPESQPAAAAAGTARRSSRARRAASST